MRFGGFRVAWDLYYLRYACIEASVNRASASNISRVYEMRRKTNQTLHSRLNLDLGDML